MKAKDCGFGKITADEYFAHVLHIFNALSPEEQDRIRNANTPYAKTVRKALRYASGLKAVSKNQ